MTTSQRSINIAYVSQCSDVSDYVIFVVQFSATSPFLATMLALQVPQSSQMRARLTSLSLHSKISQQEGRHIGRCGQRPASPPLAPRECTHHKRRPDAAAHLSYHLGMISPLSSSKSRTACMFMPHINSQIHLPVSLSTQKPKPNCRTSEPQPYAASLHEAN